MLEEKCLRRWKWICSLSIPGGILNIFSMGNLVMNVYVCVYWQKSHLPSNLAFFWYTTFFFFLIYIWVLSHYSICIHKITHLPGSDLMAFNNYNYTFWVLHQSSVLHSLAGILAFKNAEKLIEVSFIGTGCT